MEIGVTQTIQKRLKNQERLSIDKKTEFLHTNLVSIKEGNEISLGEK